MGWKTTKFVRSTLYTEVWAEPVVTVAARYGISDVGLRKICRKLAIPTPPLGFWAKKRAGKHVKQVPLPASRGPSIFESSRYEPSREESDRYTQVSEHEQVIRQREFEARPENAISVNSDLVGCHRLVTATRRSLRSNLRPIYGVVSPSGSSTTLPISVSPNQVDRALSLFAAVLRAAEIRKFKVAKKPRTDYPGSYEDFCVEVFGEPMFISIDERVRRIDRALAGDDVLTKELPQTPVSDRWIYHPTGILKLTVRDGFRGRTAFQLVDKDGLRLDSQLNQLMVELVAAAMLRKSERLAAEERRREDREREAERYRRQQIREEQLKALHRIEGLAERWERAKRLRRFANALANGSLIDETGAAHLRAQVQWIRDRADWLDPLVLRPWPEVAEAQAWYPNGSWMNSYADLENLNVDDILVSGSKVRDC